MAAGCARHRRCDRSRRIAGGPSTRCRQGSGRSTRKGSSPSRSAHGSTRIACRPQRTGNVQTPPGSYDAAPMPRLAGLLILWVSVAALAQTPRFDLEEATIADLQERMQSGRETSRSIVEKYLARIDAVDRSGPALHSVIETNPDALAIADRLDEERKRRGPRGPLHGIPILIKDNIATADQMHTTAGSLALADSKPPKDAFVVQRLREAGTVILGKTNLSEWANFRSTHSTSGWSGRGGQTKNPYALDRNPS